MNSVRDNQKVLIIKHLQEGNKLTVAEALTRFGIYALSQRVGEINRGNFGITIKSTMVQANGKRFAEYSKKEEV